MANDPAAHDPVANDRITNEPAANGPAANGPAANGPAANGPAATNGPVSRAVAVARRRPRLVIASAVVLAAALGTGLGLGLSAPATPQWCGPLLAELRIHGGNDGSFQDLMSSLGRMEKQDHAPVGTLMSDFRAQVRSRSLNYPALDRVVTDLQSLNRTCGQPPNAYANDVS